MAVCSFADQSYRYDHDYAGSYVGGFAWRGVLHSTETTGRPSYQGGAVAPHFTVDPRTGKTWQHYDTARPSRALQHPPGTVDTNNARCIQIEIIAYSDNSIAKKVSGLRVDSLTEGQLEPIRRLMRWIEDTHGVKPTAVHTWKPYPASAGTGNGVRISSSTWVGFNGWAGHQHVPNNDHGDPSDINITALLEDDMPTADEIAQATVNELFARSMTNRLDPTGKTEARFDTMFEENYKLTRLGQEAIAGLPAAVVAALKGALPPAAVGGLTVADVEQALRNVLTNGIGATS